jgi:serine/threonine-protein phosphatase PGAM5
MAKRTLFLVRHGHYELETGYLTPLGHEQAKLIGARLSGVPVQSYYCSALLRAQQTAENMSGILGSHAKVLSLLNEGLPSRVKGYPTDTIPKDQERFAKVFERFTKPKREPWSDLIVCHGNLIRYLVCRALKIPHQRWVKFGINHASLTKVVVRADGTTGIVSFNDTGHLPPDWVS